MQVRVDSEDGRAVIHLDGDIDESIDSIADTLGSLQQKKWIFDCTGVGKINSMGSSIWIRIFKALPSDVEYRFRNCTLSFVDMAVMVPAFIQKRPIDSIFVPYHCGDCSNEHLELYSLLEDTAVADSQACPKCGGRAVVDEDVHDDLEALSEVS